MRETFIVILRLTPCCTSDIVIAFSVNFQFSSLFYVFLVLLSKPFGLLTYVVPVLPDFRNIYKDIHVVLFRVPPLVWQILRPHFPSQLYRSRSPCNSNARKAVDHRSPCCFPSRPRPWTNRKTSSNFRAQEIGLLHRHGKKEGGVLAPIATR